MVKVWRVQHKENPEILWLNGKIWTRLSSVKQAITSRKKSDEYHFTHNNYIINDPMTNYEIVEYDIVESGRTQILSIEEDRRNEEAKKIEKEAKKKARELKKFLTAK